MTLRIPPTEILSKFTTSEPILTPAMTITVYDISGKQITVLDAPPGCRLEFLAAWMANDLSFIKYMYTIRGGRMLGHLKRLDLIVELIGVRDYAKFVGVYDLDSSYGKIH